jgi:hypothetical protein
LRLGAHGGRHGVVVGGDTGGRKEVGPPRVELREKGDVGDREKRGDAGPLSPLLSPTSQTASPRNARLVAFQLARTALPARSGGVGSAGLAAGRGGEGSSPPRNGAPAAPRHASCDHALSTGTSHVRGPKPRASAAAGGGGPRGGWGRGQRDNGRTAQPTAGGHSRRGEAGGMSGDSDLGAPQAAHLAHARHRPRPGRRGRPAATRKDTRCRA